MPVGLDGPPDKDLGRLFSGCTAHNMHTTFRVCAEEWDVHSRGDGATLASSNCAAHIPGKCILLMSVLMQTVRYC